MNDLHILILVFAITFGTVFIISWSVSNYDTNYASVEHHRPFIN